MLRSLVGSEMCIRDRVPGKSPKKVFSVGNETLEFTDSEAEGSNSDGAEVAAPEKVAEVASITAPAKKLTTSKSKGTLSELPLVMSSAALGKTSGAYLFQGSGAKVDMSGDTGAIGRIEVDKHKGLAVDLKGIKYAGDLFSCPGLMVVNTHGSEAKIETVLDAFIQLCPIEDHLNMETVVGGDLAEYEPERANPTQGSPEEENGKSANKSTKSSKLKRSATL
eukprot:TRINITY_DN43231_c0_g1_i2.p1 TRINITY_DN43231_c0_g1~~TRINITY_DN43231_c0_g1_i2.p1  ORF type:complete len:222 (-),score=51.48 TRINITY_DN43231_c0_g1_i2:229-894(-)